MSKLLRFILGKKHQLEAICKLKYLQLVKSSIDGSKLAKERWGESLSRPTEYYLYCARFYFQGLPQEIVEHRNYFSKHGRGFGENAFHVLWWMLFRELKPQSFLEIGVYRGQTSSLAALLQREFNIHGKITCISPFLPVGDNVSTYRSDVDYQSDTLNNFKHFDLPEPILIKAYSNDSVAIEKIQSQLWDAIYIDGNHEYAIAKQDWLVCSENLRLGGIIVLDDSALYTEYSPPVFATAGHPGPSQLAQEIDASRFEEILRVGHNRVYQKTG